MGLLKGKANYLRFLLSTTTDDGTLEPMLPPDNFEEPFCDLIAQHGFRDIDPHGDQDEAVGWVRIDDAFSAEHDPRTLVNNDGYLLLRLRIDKLKVPAITLKAYVEQAEREAAIAQGKDQLSNVERKQIAAEQKKKLRLRSLPGMQLIEVAWQVQTGEVRLFSISNTVAAVFVGLFEKTFSRPNLMPIGLVSVLRKNGWKHTDIEGIPRPEHFHLVERS